MDSTDVEGIFHMFLYFHLTLVLTKLPLGISPNSPIKNFQAALFVLIYY